MPAALRFLRDRRGASATEFALVAPAMLLIALSLVDLGRIGLVMASLTRSAQEAARYASLHGAESPAPATVAAIEAVARARIYGVPPDAIAVSVSWTPDNASGASVTVATSSPFEILLGLLPIDTVTLDGHSSLTIQ